MAAIENVRRTKLVVLAMQAALPPLCLLHKCRATDSRPPPSGLQAILVSGDSQRMSMGECGRHRTVQAVLGALRLRGNVERAGNSRDLGLSGLVARFERISRRRWRTCSGVYVSHGWCRTPARTDQHVVLPGRGRHG
jgi:hypothetical protein